jgi:hypothetical protein
VLAEEAGRLVISKSDTYSPEMLVAQARVLVAALARDGIPQPAPGGEGFEAELAEAQAEAAELAEAAKVKAKAKPKAAAKPAAAKRPRAKKPSAETPAG